MNILRDMVVRLGFTTADGFDRTVARAARGIGGLGRIMASLTAQAIAFEAAARGMEARLGQRALAWNIRNVNRAFVATRGVLGLVIDQWSRYRAGIGLVNEELTEHTRLISRQAEVLGVTTSEYQQLTFGMGEFGLTTHDVNSVLSRFAAQAEEALHKVRGATSRARGDFQKLGIDVNRLRGKNALGILEEVAHAYKYADNQETAKRAVGSLLGEEMGSLFGEDLTERLLPALAKGAEGITDLRRAARDTGLVIREDLVEAGASLADQFGVLNRMVEVFWANLGLRLAPVVERLVVYLQDLYLANADWINQNLDLYIDRIATAAEYLDSVLRDIDWQTVLSILTGGALFVQFVASALAAAFAGAVWLGVLAAISAIMQLLTGYSIPGLLIALAGYVFEVLVATLATLGFEGALLPLAAALGVVALAVGAVLVGLIALTAWMGAALAVVVLAVDDFLSYMRGAPSVIGLVLDYIQEFMPALQGVGEFLQSWGSAFYEFWALIGQIIWEIGTAISTVFGVEMSELLTNLMPLLIAFGIVVYGMLWALAQLFDLMAENLRWLRENIDGLGESFGSFYSDYATWLMGIPKFTTIGPQLVTEGILQPAAAQLTNYNSSTANEVNMQVTVEGGDPEAVTEATRRGIREALEGSLE